MTSIPMVATDAAREERRVFQHARDTRLFGAAIALGLAIAACILIVERSTRSAIAASAAVAALVGFAIVWGSNTVSHNHLHNPIFTRASYNRAFSAYLSVVLGVPQTIWRARHLWHHAGEPAERKPLRLGAQGWIEVGLIGSAWIAIAIAAPRFFFFAYAPGYLLGMALCTLQGRYEHTRGPGGVSYYGAIHNLFWFNDGYHAEHHERPREHWSRLPALRHLDRPESRFPPLLRFLEGVGPAANRAQAVALGVLEGLVLGSPRLQRFVIDRHARAIRALLPALAGRRLDRIAIVGGGLFPRTALALLRILPESRLVIVDASRRNIERARAFLGEAAARVGFVEAELKAGVDLGIGDVDLLIVPLAFVGDRAALYARGAAAPMLVHDWIWRRRGAASAVVSLVLCKRLNLVP